MSKSNAWELGLINLLFTNAAFAGVGDAGGLQPSGVAGSLYLSLHTADPGEAGDQTTNATGYTGYARVAVARAGGSWTITGPTPTQVTNAAAAVFPVCTAVPEVITHFGIGTALAGAGVLLYSEALTAPLAVSAGITPTFAIGALVVTED
jgi:hypothetical protein